MNLSEINLPQLIVALDSPNDDANYIHIKDTKEDVLYYCPCCKGLVKPRAYKDGNNYKVQPHFYHESGGCSEESFVHYICKKWLFEKECQFIIDDVLYEVDQIETEKTLHTKFGDYRPDIIVTTTVGKTFFFEIKYANKKTTDYIPKWDELGNDVVKVDVRYFINQKFENDIPTFSLIYSDGECFIKSYSRQDYESIIAKRKLEWKRQDKLNYKIQWEHLDWFWRYLQEYKIDNTTKENVIETFKELDILDMGICWDLVFNKSQCLKDLKADIREVINHKSISEFNRFISQKKEKYKNIIKFEGYYCAETIGIYVKWEFTKKYSLFGHVFCDTIVINDKKWIIHPNIILKFEEIFNSKEVCIEEHVKNINTINRIMESDVFINNALTLLENEKIYIYNPFFNKEYITDAEKTIKEIKKILQNEVCNYYIKNIAIQKDEIAEMLYGYFDELKIYTDLSIGEEPSFWNSPYYFNISYKGFNIFKIKIDNTSITVGEDSIDYYLCKNNSFQDTIISLLDNKLKNVNHLTTNFDFIHDVCNLSNSTWKFTYDVEKNCFKITLSYFIPYLNDYTERIEVSENVSIPYESFDNCTIFEYKNTIKFLLDQHFAPIMQQMLDDQIEKYNALHLTSIAYKKSEVMHDK